MPRERTAVARARTVMDWQLDSSVAPVDYPQFVKTGIAQFDGIVRTIDGYTTITLNTHAGFRTARDGDHIVYEPARSRLHIMSEADFDNQYAVTPGA